MKYEGFVTPLTGGGGGGGFGCFVALIIVGIIIYGIIIGQIRLPFTSGSGPAQQTSSPPQAAPKPQPNRSNPSVSNPSPTSTVATQHYQIPSIKADVTAVRFFNNGGNITSKVYQSRFAKSEARYINWELHLRHPAPGERTCFNIDAVYYKPDNSIFGTQTKESCLESSWTSSYHGTGKGWVEPGNWQAGTYRVELSIEHNVVARGSFEVYEDTRAVQPIYPVEQPVPYPQQNPQPRRNDDRTGREEHRGPGVKDALIRGAQKALEEYQRRRRRN